MTKRLGGVVLLVCAGVLGAAPPATAQQTFNLTLGYFMPRGEDARVDGDVLVANRDFLTFEINELGGPSVGAEWLIPLGNFLEAGAGIGFSRRTVPSVYTEFRDSDGTEVDQDLRLRILPMALTLRVLPLGQSSGVQPYFGVGLGILNWRYSESGEFVDFAAGRRIFRDSFVADGNETGPIALGGIRFASDSFSAGGEVRYQSAAADVDSRFAGSKIDLGGWTYQLTLGVRFGR